MPKKRKTRKQKILIDERKHVAHELESETAPSKKEHAHTNDQAASQTTATFTLSSTATPQAPDRTKPRNANIAVALMEYSYLSKDLLKTALLTSSVILAELVIKVMMRG